ncbi:MAG TPA: aminotransferase class I/II-fold pyridoxal phosphate-dependent enzyme [Vicinamibacterales bacterium]|nr:aminotransferase class I/II-fold pyridoxal phosphate-dependent enzyme [Vicinamibacterales bacterium]
MKLSKQMNYEYEKVVTPSSGLRLHLNENTAGCSPAVLDAIRGITCETAAFYPDYADAIAACCEHLEVPASSLLLTNGLDEGILAASVAALRGSPAADPFEAIVIVPAFDMYAACADAAGGRVIEIPQGDDFEFPLDAVLAAVGPRTRIVFITTPNNPTGITVPRSSILAIAAAAPGSLIFVDEAYVDFSGVTLVGDPSMETHSNLVVGRTFAKAYGLAAIRAGALIGSPETLAPIRRVVPPYSLNVAAAVAIPAALRDRERYDWYLGEVRRSKRLLYDAFDRLDVRYWPSDGNFVLVRFGEMSGRVVSVLAERGIYLRDRSKDHGCSGCVRITAGVAEHTRRCIDAIEEVLCDAR